MHRLPAKFCRGCRAIRGLGHTLQLWTRQTEQYFGPTVAFTYADGMTFKFSPEFGLNDNPRECLWRFGVTYEINSFAIGSGGSNEGAGLLLGVVMVASLIGVWRATG